MRDPLHLIPNPPNDEIYLRPFRLESYRVRDIGSYLLVSSEERSFLVDKTEKVSELLSWIKQAEAEWLRGSSGPPSLIKAPSYYALSVGGRVFELEEEVGEALANTPTPIACEAAEKIASVEKKLLEGCVSWAYRHASLYLLRNEGVWSFYGSSRRMLIEAPKLDPWEARGLAYSLSGLAFPVHEAAAEQALVKTTTLIVRDEELVYRARLGDRPELVLVGEVSDEGFGASLVKAMGTGVVKLRWRQLLHALTRPQMLRRIVAKPLVEARKKLLKQLFPQVKVSERWVTAASKRGVWRISLYTGSIRIDGVKQCARSLFSTDGCAVVNGVEIALDPTTAQVVAAIAHALSNKPLVDLRRCGVYL